MRSVLPISVLLTAGLSASMNTIRSTTISSISSCSSSSASSSSLPSSSALSVVPDLSSARYLNTTIQTIRANSATSGGDSSSGSDSESPETRYEYETDTDYTHITKTVCDSNNNCYVTVDSESLTTYTTTIDGVLTVITTGVSASAAATADAESTIASTSGVASTSDIVSSSSGTTAVSPISTKAAIESSSSLTSSKPQETQYEYETDIDVSHVVKTVCNSESKCYLTTQVQSSTTYTTTIDGVLTVITTDVPISKTNSPLVVTSSGAVATEESTETEVLTTVMTVTSCSDNKCSSTVFTSGFSVYTVDETAYTTYFPVTTITSKLSSASINGEATNTKSGATVSATSTTTTAGNPQETETKISTAIVTITSCSNNKCHEETKTTGIKVYTSEETIYTTYCPLSSTSETTNVVSVETPKPQSKQPNSSPVVEKSSSLEATSSNTATTTTTAGTSSNPPVTINVISGNIVTETPVVNQVQSTSKHSDQSSTIAISTYEGVGATVFTTNITGFLSLVVSLIFFMI